MQLASLRNWSRSLLESAGLSAEDARTAAEVFLRTSVRGVGHHDIYFLPQRLRLLTEGTMNPSGKITEVKSEGAMKVFDGDGALGEVCVSRIMEEAVSLAGEFGVGLATIRHSNHFLAASAYAEMAAEAGCIGMIWSNTDPCMGGPEAHAKVIGNNPFGFGAPLNENPAMLDISMAYTSLGKLGDYIKRDRSVPSYWGRNEHGFYTTDPQAILDRGICAPMSEHKGYGMAVMHELLTAGLSGGEMTDEVVPVGGWCKHSQTALAIRVDAFTDLETFRERARRMFRGMEAKDPSARVPGARSYHCKDEYQQQGIPLSEKLIEQLKAWSERLGVMPPEGA